VHLLSEVAKVKGRSLSGRWGFDVHVGSRKQKWMLIPVDLRKAEPGAAVASRETGDTLAKSREPLELNLRISGEGLLHQINSISDTFPFLPSSFLHHPRPNRKFLFCGENGLLPVEVYS